MLQRQQRKILEFMIWAVAAVLTPYSTFLLVKYGDLLFLGAPVLNALLFIAAMLCTKINSSLNEEIERQTSDADEPLSEEEMAEVHLTVGGLRVLRLASSSPLRGFGLERGIIRTINGEVPDSAEAANNLIVRGRNEIEWVSRSGKQMTSYVHTQENDLRAQFEQIKPPASPDPESAAETT